MATLQRRPSGKTAPGIRPLVFSLTVGVLFFCPPVLAERGGTEKAGDAGLILLPVAAYGTALFLGDTEGRRQFHKAFLLNAALTLALKETVSKTRPDGSDRDSFPSGHTSISFQSAAWLQKRYGWRYGVPAYAVATFVGYSRVEADKHHIEDVLAGAALGLASSYLFTDRYPGLEVEPMAGRDLLGVRFRLRW